MRPATPFLVLTGLVLAAAGRRDDVLVSAPPEGRSEARFVEETSWELDDFDMTFDGGHVEQDFDAVTGTARREFAVTDESHELDGPRVTRFVRSYDELAMETTFRVDASDAELDLPSSWTSELEGLEVRFRWDEDEEAYERELAEGREAPELLAGLTARLDLAELLPEDEVAEDDTWAVDPELAALFLRPGGDLVFEVDEIAEGSVFTVPKGAVAATSLAAFGEGAGDWSGELVGRYLGAEEGQAHLRFTVDVAAEHDQSERFAAVLEAAGGSEDEAALDFEVDVQGVLDLTWDLEAGGPVEWVFEGEFALEASAAWMESLFDQEVAFSGTFQTSGSTRIEGAYEVE